MSSATVGNWRDRFIDAGKAGMDRSLPGPDGGQSQTERRLRHECEQLKLALAVAEAAVQLRIWQKGSEYVEEVPSPTSADLEALRVVIDYATKYCIVNGNRSPAARRTAGSAAAIAGTFPHRKLGM